ncbi:MAG TPA: S8 family serine peptidase, partial [Polyangiaceae bacterium]|nr:S8 family serine peptidase [Polyangiaceae bacterium]
MTRKSWDFDYRLASPGYDAVEASDVVVAALARPASERELLAAFGAAPEVTIRAVIERAPIFWYRLAFRDVKRLDDVTLSLARAGLPCRYVTPATQGNLALGEPLDFDGARHGVATDWAVLPSRVHDEPKTPDRWVFHERGGIDVDRALCGTGAGTRLAVIDDEGMDSDVLPLDREITVGTSTPSRSALHGPLMVAWAVGVRPSGHKGIAAFTGVAPDASPRLYLIPKAGRDVVSLPEAIVRAVDDGADVVVCASYVEGTTSPLFDDALAFANQLGRGGRGTAVVLPTGREISSPPGSMHASLTLSLGDPASDPRVFCVAPSGRYGDWFLWTDKRGRLRPFANRGPSVRLAAPGDDMSYPLAGRDRVGHAESSGASAIAAGVALLVYATSPELMVHEL